MSELWAIRCPVSLHNRHPGPAGTESRVAELQMANVLVEVSGAMPTFQFNVTLAERVRWRVKARTELTANWWAAHLGRGVIATATFPAATAKGGGLTGCWFTLDPNPRVELHA